MSASMNSKHSLRHSIAVNLIYSRLTAILHRFCLCAYRLSLQDTLFSHEAQRHPLNKLNFLTKQKRPNIRRYFRKVILAIYLQNPKSIEKIIGAEGGI